MALIRITLALLISAFAFMSAEAKAQSFERGRDMDRNSCEQVEMRVRQLEDTVYRMDQRLRQLERGGDSYQPERREVACILRDTISGGYYLGKGRTQLEADQASRASCGRSTASVYCQAQVKCSTQEVVRRGAICVVKNTINARTYKGDAQTLIEAEFNARKACSSDVAAVYCGAQISCDTY